ncbi:unnamed protein product [Coffea canephora]|uniref:RING-type E3 ubiquitin transferase n=1 Tax=Coffea canephora TaxID=49390 RepID=A0A068U452_COFCA|nr:unnamed protein product [Coffea canephora]
MSLFDVEEMFDLDTASTIPETTRLDGSSSDDQTNPMKLSESNASRHNRQVELPAVAATGACTVCMEAFVETGKQVPCGHVFHAECIGKWLTVRNSCPLCRFSVFSAGQASSTTTS